MVSRPFAVVALMAAYNEADIIGQVVADLVAQGIGVYLMDHGSTDGTAAAVAAWRGRGLLGVERFPEESGIEAPADRFDLAGIVRRKETLARELDADWFINADADEFRESPWPHLSLRDAIRLVDRLGWNAIDFEVLNFWPTHDGFRPGDDPRQVFRGFERAPDCDRLQIRGWKKTGGPVDLVSTAGHEARFPERRVFPIRFPLRHYPIRSQAHGERKIFRERLPRFASTERERGWHVQYDDVGEGQSLLRDAARLTPYDADAERVQLVLRHRGVEELEEALGAARRAVEEMRGELEARGAEIERMQRAAARMRADLEARANQVAAIDRERSAGVAEIERLRAAVAEIGRRLDEVYASRSWRWMAPLRAAYRLLGGR